jgi:hypothetical protein
MRRGPFCGELGIPAEWCEDGSNLVLACAACNTFRNRYKPSNALPVPRTKAEFFDLRDRIFADRKEKISQGHREDRAFFEGRPWEA